MAGVVEPEVDGDAGLGIVGLAGRGMPPLLPPPVDMLLRAKPLGLSRERARKRDDLRRAPRASKEKKQT